MNRIALTLTSIILLGMADSRPVDMAPPCLAGERADEFLRNVQHRLSATDSSAQAWRAEMDLPTSDRADVRVVTDESVCERASREYRKHAGPGGALPFTVAVVIAPGLYVVELGETAGRDAEYWEVVLFSREWKRIASYGGGS